MTLQARNQHVRVIVPIGVDHTEVHVYPVMLKGAPEKMNRDFVNLKNLPNLAPWLGRLWEDAYCL
jgi:hypothetical protein